MVLANQRRDLHFFITKKRKEIKNVSYKTKNIFKIIISIFLLSFIVTSLTSAISAVSIEEISSDSMIHRNTLIFDNSYTSNITYKRTGGTSNSNTRVDSLNRLVVEFPDNAQATDSFDIIYDYVGKLNGEQVGAILSVSNIVYGYAYSESADNTLPQAIYFNPAIWKGINQFKIKSCDYNLSFFRKGNVNDIVNTNGAYMTFGSLNYYENRPETVAPLTSISKAYTLPKNNSPVTTNIVSSTVNGLQAFHATTNERFVDSLGDPNFPANAVSFDYTGEIGFRIITEMGSLWFTFDTAPLTLTEPLDPIKTVSANSLLAGKDQILNYTVSQKVHALGIDAYIRYTSFIMQDQLDPKIDYVGATVTDSLGNTLTSDQCTITYNSSSRTVKATFSASFLQTMPLNGETYYLNISTITNSSFISTINNQGKTYINNYEGITNIVSTTPYFKITTEVINGTITKTQTNISPGSNRTISYSPNTGYMLQSITVDGMLQTWENYKNSYTFSNISGNHHIKVVYEPIPNKTITITKIWNDRNNEYNTRPSSLKINVLQNGSVFSNVVMTSSNAISTDSNKWAITTTVPERDQYRNLLTYTIQEDTSNVNLRYFYETPIYDQSNLTVTNTAQFIPVESNEHPEYKIIVHKNIIDKNENIVDANDFNQVCLNINDTYNFEITLKELNRTVTNTGTSLVESYNGYSGNVINGIVTNKGDLVFNLGDEGYGKYEISENINQYFDFVDIEKLNDEFNTSGASFSKENGKYYITLSGITGQFEQISVKVTNQIKPDRPYNETEDKENLFKI